MRLAKYLTKNATCRPNSHKNFFSEIVGITVKYVAQIKAVFVTEQLELRRSTKFRDKFYLIWDMGMGQFRDGPGHFRMVGNPMCLQQPLWLFTGLTLTATLTVIITLTITLTITTIPTPN